MKKVFLLERSGQYGYYSCLIIADGKNEALNIAKKNYFSFTENLAGDSIKELNILENQYINLIEYDNIDYQG